MNEPDQTLLLSQLAMARTNAQLGASHCQTAAHLSAIVGLTEIPKINLARVHFELAVEQLTRALQNLNVGSSIMLAPSAQEPPEASLSAPGACPDPIGASPRDTIPQHSPSLPKTEESVINSADAPASCEADGSEGVLSKKQNEPALLNHP